MFISYILHIRGVRRAGESGSSSSHSSKYDKLNQKRWYEKINHNSSYLVISKDSKAKGMFNLYMFFLAVFSTFSSAF